MEYTYQAMHPKKWNDTDNNKTLRISFRNGKWQFIGWKKNLDGS
jgi:hypothetical protein